MTPRQQEFMLRYWPLIVAAGSLLVGWTTLKIDVGNALPVQRFIVDSISNLHDHRDFERRLTMTEQANQRSLDAICRAVRCK